MRSRKGRCRSLPSSRWPRPGSAPPVPPEPPPSRRAPSQPAPAPPPPEPKPHRPTPTPPPTAPERGDADLVIWTDDTRQPVDRGDRRAVRRGERHHRRRPGARVRRHPRAADARPRPAGEGPDIVIGAHDWLGELVANGVVEPLDLSGVADGFNPVAVEAFTYDGQTYGLPYAVENIALVRNTDLVPEAPATFEEMIADRHRLQGRARRRPDVPGPRRCRSGRRATPTTCSRSCRRSAATSSPRTRTARSTPTTSASTPRAVSRRRRCCRSRPPPGCSAPTSRYDVMIESFGSRQGAVRHHRPVGDQPGRQRLRGHRRAVRRQPDPGPRGRRGAAAVFVGVQGFMISSFSEQKDLATSFVLDYMSQESSQLALFEAGGRPPALTSAYDQVQTTPTSPASASRRRPASRCRRSRR